MKVDFWSNVPSVMGFLRLCELYTPFTLLVGKEKDVHWLLSLLYLASEMSQLHWNLQYKMVCTLNCTTIHWCYVNQNTGNRCTDQTDTVTFNFHFGGISGKLLMGKDEHIHKVYKTIQISLSYGNVTTTSHTSAHLSCLIHLGYNTNCWHKQGLVFLLGILL